MNKAIDLISALADTLVSILVYPFKDLSPWWGLLVVSALTGVLFLLVYGRISFQKSIKKTKRSIHASLLEVILFRHDLKVCLKAQFALFLNGITYFCLAVPPMLLMALPCIFILAQLEMRYGARPLRAGESSVFLLKVKDPSNLRKIKIIAEPGVMVTPPVRLLDTNEIAWRLDSTRAGSFPLQIEVEGGTPAISQTLEVETHPGFLDRGSYSNPWMRLLYPGKPLNSALQGIVENSSLEYPTFHLKFLGHPIHWLLVFLVVSMLSGILVSRFLKIEI